MGGFTTFVSKIPFAMTTAHFLHKEFKLTSCVLETIYFPGNHIAIHISEKIKEILLQYNISSEETSLLSMTKLS